MVAVRLTLLASLVCVLGCASGMEAPYGVAIDDGDGRYDGPPKVIRRFDASTSTTDGSEEEDEDDAVEDDAGAWLTLPDGGFPEDDGADAEIAPAFASQPSDTTRQATIDAGAVAAATLRCRAGTYTGVFAGEIRALVGIVRSDILGTLRFQLPAATGDRLTLQSGVLEGRDKDGHPIRASLSGTLNCATGQLENGRLRDGTYTKPDPLVRGRNTTARFTGVVSGTLSGDPPVGRGSWAVDNDRNARTGSGSWAVNFAP